MCPWDHVPMRPCAHVPMDGSSAGPSRIVLVVERGAGRGPADGVPSGSVRGHMRIFG